MKKIFIMVAIVFSCLQCSQYFNHGKSEETQDVQSNVRSDKDAPVIVGFESEPTVYEDDREGLGHIFSSAQSETITFRKYFHHWHEEARFRHPITKDVINNLPIFNILVQDSDSNAGEIKLNFRVERKGHTQWISPWQKAPLIDVPYKAYHSKVLLSSKTLGYSISKAGTYEYELQLQAVDSSSHASSIVTIPFRVENLKAPITMDVDSNFQSQKNLKIKSLWNMDLKSVFTPGKLLQVDDPLIIKRYKISSPLETDTYLKVYPEFHVFYKLESHYVDTNLLEPEPRPATVLTRNELESNIRISKGVENTAQELTEPMILDEKINKYYFETKLKKGESIVLDVYTGFQYKEEPTRHVFNHGRNNLAYHRVEVEPEVTLEAIPYPNSEEYEVYRNSSNNWNFLHNTKKESIIYVQKTSI